MYCFFCIAKIFERFKSERISCPICKQQVAKSEMFHVRERKPPPAAAAAGAAIDRMAQSRSTAAATEAQSATESETTECGDHSHDNERNPAQDELAVTGDFGTKVDALIILLRRLALAEPASKSIVFSQWAGGWAVDRALSSGPMVVLTAICLCAACAWRENKSGMPGAGVLQIIAVGLETNAISFADAFSKGGRQQDKAIQTFKSSGQVGVLLLATKSGANGLNLTEATNVILVEPVMYVVRSRLLEHA
jgi:hypothetical protein